MASNTSFAWCLVMTDTVHSRRNFDAWKGVAVLNNPRQAHVLLVCSKQSKRTAQMSRIIARPVLLLSLLVQL